MMRSIVVVLLLASIGRAQGPIDPKISLERLKEIVREARNKHKVPALAAAVVTSKGIHAMTWLGVRKNGATVEVTADDRWHLGSDTKAFTATLLAVLAEQGKIDMNATLPSVLPKLGATISADYKEITLSQVLRHRSGLPKDLANWWVIPTTGRLHDQRLQAIRRGLAMKPVAKPGMAYSYSNMNYVIAGAVAEEAGGAAWEDLIARHVLQPLGITSYGFGPPGKLGKMDQPLAHDKKGLPAEPTLKNDNPPVMGPSARLHLSLKDWAKFAQDQLKGARGEGKLLKPEGYKRLHSVEPGETYTPGGWITETSPGFLLLTHDGSNGGYYCSAALMPTLDIAVLVVCNQGPTAGESACRQAMVETIKATLTGK
ncbi:MAG: class A beta-lactamase-related serine hydrolase [Planctomycetia bacterium]|nr:class A beta-lactamase-related serine hydrolase [Planctomycetia bacterium]